MRPCWVSEGGTTPTPWTKERQMMSNAAGDRILGSLRSADGKGIVRIEDRVDTGIDDL